MRPRPQGGQGWREGVRMIVKTKGQGLDWHFTPYKKYQSDCWPGGHFPGHLRMEGTVNKTGQLVMGTNLPHGDVRFGWTLSLLFGACTLVNRSE